MKLTVRCPCCAEVLEVDSRDGKVLSHRKGKAPSQAAHEDPLSALLKDSEASKARAAADFDQAARRARNDGGRLDALFDDARRKADGEGGQNSGTR